MSEMSQLLAMAIRERQSDNTFPDGSSQFCAWGPYPNLACAAGDAQAMKAFGIGGWGLEADLVLIILMDDLVPGWQNPANLAGMLPVAKQTLTYNAKLYRINETTMPPGCAFIALALQDPTKGV